MSVSGVYAGVVVSTLDPENRRRVRLRIPQITGTTVSGWAEPVSFGTVAPGDQVTVAFEGGDLNFPLYWPRVTETVAAWQPLDLAPGWTASSAGTPVYRTTEDGMVELAGSVETSTSISLGATVTFATLPEEAWPLETYRATTATVYHGAYNSKTSYGEYRVTTSTTSTSYVTDTHGPSLTFIAPGSGQVVVVFGCFSQASNTTARCLMSCKVTSGSTVIADGDDDHSAENQGNDNASVANSRIVSGLTAGSSYTVTALYRTDDSSQTSSFDNKWMMVVPVGPHDTPAARITMLPTGELQALFPGGAAPSYDMSLTGIRARII